MFADNTCPSAAEQLCRMWVAQLWQPLEVGVARAGHVCRATALKCRWQGHTTGGAVAHCLPSQRLQLLHPAAPSLPHL